MPRGKNYVNQNKGMTLAAPKKGERVKEACMYGAACTRKDCIYDHSATKPEFQKSNDPCMAFLAGQCLFTAQTCRKRHCLPDEAEKIRAKYANTKCRFGKECRTSGCLYNHEDNPYKSSLTVKTAPPRISLNRGKEPPVLNEAAFPPLSGSKPIDCESTEEENHEEQHQHQHQQHPPALPLPQYTAAPMTTQQRHYMAMLMMQQRQQQQQQRQQRQQQQSHGWIPTPPGNLALQAGASVPTTATTTSKPMIPGGISSSLQAHAPSYNPYGNSSSNSCIPPTSDM